MASDLVDLETPTALRRDPRHRIEPELGEAFTPDEPQTRFDDSDLSGKDDERPLPVIELPPEAEPVFAEQTDSTAPEAEIEATAGALPIDKIVALRLTSSQSRFDGPELVAAMQAAGLEHGRYSIFHCHSEEGATLYSVASLVEPGTFDLNDQEGRQYPGVAFFAQLSPGSASSEIFESMLHTAQKLAQQLDGQLQDERGAPLTLQRLMALRAELAEWRRATTATPA